MPRDPLTLGVEAQQVLDELWSERLIPFALNVGKITKDGDAYIIHFYDSRLHSARVPPAEGQSFSQLVREAVLAGSKKIIGPPDK